MTQYLLFRTQHLRANGLAMKALIKRIVVRDHVLTRSVLAPYRLWYAAQYYTPTIRLIWKWLVKSKETTNYTYDLTPTNLRYLAHYVSVITACPLQRIMEYFHEPEYDSDLIKHLASAARCSPVPGVTDDYPHFGRRIVWYAFARALKPSVVVETGVDKGLGAVLLCSALVRNGQEGYPGQYYGTDINPKAGFLLGGKYASVGKILVGDSIQSLRGLRHVDLFINDSDHSADYEYQEYQTIATKISDDSVILGDNSHCTDCLVRFAEETGRSFLFVKEQPKDHWYPGGGVGVCFNLSARLADATMAAPVCRAAMTN